MEDMMVGGRGVMIWRVGGGFFFCDEREDTNDTAVCIWKAFVGVRRLFGDDGYSAQFRFMFQIGIFLALV
jgi:hypothetical protein